MGTEDIEMTNNDLNELKALRKRVHDLRGFL
jgi:hypothetical protein